MICNNSMNYLSSEYCIDCSASPVTFVSLNNGVLICNNCRIRHAILGQDISLVKSLEQITDKEIFKISLGGNEKFNDFMEIYDLCEFPAHIKYKTIAAQYYRNLVFFVLIKVTRKNQ